MGVKSMPFPKWARIAVVLVPVLLAGVLTATIASSCASARTAASTFLTALHDGRVDDARAVARGPVQIHIGIDPPVATPAVDPQRTIAFIRAAKRVEIDGVVQSGFGDGFAFFVCYDAKIDDTALFWIVVRKFEGAWLVESLASEEPESCKGGD